jgi:hypothetical protein
MVRYFINTTEIPIVTIMYEINLQSKFFYNILRSINSKQFILIKMNKKEQKLISFLDSKEELEKISNEMKDGWKIVNLIKNGNYFAGIMEKFAEGDEQGAVYIPPRKQFKII